MRHHPLSSKKLSITTASIMALACCSVALPSTFRQSKSSLVGNKQFISNIQGVALVVGWTAVQYCNKNLANLCSKGYAWLGGNYLTSLLSWSSAQNVQPFHLGTGGVAQILCASHHYSSEIERTLIIQIEVRYQKLLVQEAYARRLNLGAFEA